MTANDLISGLTQVVFLICFAGVVVRAVRRPLRSSVDIALFFGMVALIIGESGLIRLLDAKPPTLVTDVLSAELMALPYLLLRIVDDFAAVPGWLLRLAEAGLALSFLGLVLIR